MLASQKPSFRRIDFLPIAAALFYFGLIHATMGLRLEHIVLVGFLLFCYFFHERSRKFSADFLPLAIFGALYDFLRVLPKSWAGPIRVEGPYRLELFLFGIGNPPRTLNEILAAHTSVFCDVLTSLTYSVHIVVPLAFVFLLWKYHHHEARRFNTAFLCMNLLAFATYILLPVAPPWYVAKYGFLPGNWAALPQAAGMVRFDKLIGFPYFQNIYAKSAWLYGAIPSMHAGFPTLTFLWSLHSLRRFSIPLAGFMMLMWFSAVYLGHHYLIDVIAGVAYAFLIWALSRFLISRKRSATTSTLHAVSGKKNL